MSMTPTISYYDNEIAGIKTLIRQYDQELNSTQDQGIKDDLEAAIEGAFQLLAVYELGRHDLVYIHPAVN